MHSEQNREWVMVPEMRRIKRIHFIGIGGAGMSGIAEVLYNQGYDVYGSDIKNNQAIERLRALGVIVYLEHDEKNIVDTDVVVISSAINDDNTELIYARKKLIPIVQRAEMLGELMRNRHSILVAGTHGKSTTTSMLVSILGEHGLDPTFVVGGLVQQTSSNGSLGASKYMVAEADESDASFLHLQPMVAIVTNIDRDHMETYKGNIKELQKAFISFLHNLPFYGLAVICVDDEYTKILLKNVYRPIYTYGFNKNAQFRITNASYIENQSEFTIERPDGLKSLTVKLNVPGSHNVLNAAAAIAVATDENVSDESIVKGLCNFKGVGRRFEILGNYKLFANPKVADVLLVDDYGHHPREIQAVVEAVRGGYPKRRLFMIFQPHRYSRTRDLFEDFVHVLSQVDQLIVTEVYGAGEEEIPRADGRSLCKSIRQLGLVDPIFVEEEQQVLEVIENLIQPGDLVITQGAGSVNNISKGLVKIFVDTEIAITSSGYHE